LRNTQGVLRDGLFVAVKKFKSPIENKSFLDEVDCLTRIEHSNIVQYLGFCAGAYNHPEKFEGLNILRESPHQLICFEYLRNGSLRQHIAGKIACSYQSELQHISAANYGSILIMHLGENITLV
jgi:serine/threonine protein kinase